MKIKTYTRLSLEEREQIYQGIVKGEKFFEIAETIGRMKSTILEEIKRNGGREYYNPYKAHERYRKNKTKTLKKRSENYKAIINSDPHKILCTRVDNLEMQLEIALDIIIELKNKGNDD